MLLGVVAFVPFHWTEMGLLLAAVIRCGFGHTKHSSFSLLLSRSS